jgi:uncharacterized protein
MKRFMVYLFNDKFSPQDAKAVLKQARDLAVDSDIVMRDVRVATDFLEIDTSLPDDIELGDALSLLNHISPLVEYQKVEDSYMDKEVSIEYARDLFNSQKYWRTHEVLEAVWKSSVNTEKQILNSIILISAALVHYQKNESEICISILKRALIKLDKNEGKYFGIDLDDIRAKISKIVKTGVVEKLTI